MKITVNMGSVVLEAEGSIDADKLYRAAEQLKTNETKHAVFKPLGRKEARLIIETVLKDEN